MSLELIWTDHGVQKKFGGFIGAEEFIRSGILIEGDPCFDNIRFVINDLTEISGHQISSKDLL